MRRLTALVALLAGSAVAYEASVDARLIAAIKDQNHKAIAALLAAHADVNAALPDGSTPLAWAAYQDDTETAAALLEAGAKAETADQYGETPLTLACANGNAALAGMLLKAGASAKAQRWNGETALMIAAGSGNPALIQMLLEHGATVDPVEANKGQNALMWAAANGHEDAVRLLLKAGANPNTASKSGFTPLVFASERGDVKIADRLLAAGADVNRQLSGGLNPLLIAVTSKQPEMARLLVAHGATLTTADRNGNTALHMAAQLGETALVKDLIAKGVDLNAKTSRIPAGGRGGGGGFRGSIGEQTPLMLAARADHLDIMRALVEAGADPKLRAQNGSTLLMAAAGSGHVDVVQYAYELDPGSIKDVTDTKQTVMHATVSIGLQGTTQPEVCQVVQFLADHGAELDPLDANGRTPIIIADALPIDMAVELLTKLIRATGAEPHVKTKR